ncbi:MAG: hypothetical protein RLN75_08260 [Longimicrobiales bacterium]
MLEVVLQDLAVDRLARDVDDPAQGVAQPDQREEQALLVERRPVDLGEFLLVTLIDGTITAVCVASPSR